MAKPLEKPNKKIKQISTLWLQPFKNKESSDKSRETLYWKKKIRQSI